MQSAKRKTLLSLRASAHTGVAISRSFRHFSLEIVTFYHSTGGLPRPFGPRNDEVIFPLNNNLSFLRLFYHAGEEGEVIVTGHHEQEGAVQNKVYLIVGTGGSIGFGLYNGVSCGQDTFLVNGHAYRVIDFHNSQPRHIRYGGKIGIIVGKYIRDSQLFHSLNQIGFAVDVKLRQTEVEPDILLAFPFIGVLCQLQILRTVQNLFHGYTFIGKNQPHTAAAQLQFHGTEIGAPIVLGIGGLVHKGSRQVTAWTVEDAISGLGQVEADVPACGKVSGGSQSENGARIQFCAFGLLLQQTSGLLVEPFLKEFVHFICAQIAMEYGCVVAVCEGLGGRVFIWECIIQP